MLNIFLKSKHYLVISFVIKSALTVFIGQGALNVSMSYIR